MKAFRFALLCFIWGFTWLAIKISLEGMPPYLGASFRFVLALIILSLYNLWKKIPLRVSRKEFRLLAVSGFLVYTIDYGLIYWGEQYINAGVAAIFFATFPLFTSIISNFLFRHEPFQGRQFFGLLIGFLGIIIVFYDQLVITQFDRWVLFGSFAIIIGSVSAALSLIIVKKYLHSMHPFTLTFHQLWIGTLPLLLLGLFFEDIHSIHLNIRILSAVLYLSIAGSAIAFLLWYRLLQQISAITLSLIIYITPIVALVGDYIVFKEIVPLRSFIGMAVVFIGIHQIQRTALPFAPMFRNWKNARKSRKSG